MHIPSYVYVLLFVLAYIGIKRGFPSTVKLQRLFFTPLFFIMLSLRGVTTLFDMGRIEILLWLAGGFIGFLLGTQHVRTAIIKADHNHQLIRLPGDWSMLVLILSIFLFEFFIHYSIESHLAYSSNMIFVNSSISIFGLIAGLSIGRTWVYFNKYKTTQSEPLSET